MKSMNLSVRKSPSFRFPLSSPGVQAAAALTLGMCLSLQAASAHAGGSTVRKLASDRSVPAANTAPVGHADLDLGQAVDASSLEERAAAERKAAEERAAAESSEKLKADVQFVQALTLRHEDSLHSAAFSPDGRTVVTGSFDNTARIWDVASGRMLTTLSGHGSYVHSAAFSPDGRR